MRKILGWGANREYKYSSDLRITQNLWVSYNLTFLDVFRFKFQFLELLDWWFDTPVAPGTEGKALAGIGQPGQNL